MSSTVIGMFDTYGEALGALLDLAHFGFRPAELGLVTIDRRAAEDAVGGRRESQDEELGPLVGLGTAVMPGIGSAQEGGGAAGTSSPAMGDLLASLTDAGIAEDDAEAYVEKVRDGATLVVVRSADAEVANAREILIRNGAVNYATEVAQWRAVGWGKAESPPGSTSGGDRDWEGAPGAPSPVRDEALLDPRSRLDTARSGHEEAIPYHSSDTTRGQRDKGAPSDESDYARGLPGHGAPSGEPDYARGLPGHGAPSGEPDYARGLPGHTAPSGEPDYARGQHEGQEEMAFYEHYRSFAGDGGQPFDYYKPGYQFGYELAGDGSLDHESWQTVEQDARLHWERKSRGSWQEFWQVIRYGWEKGRGKLDQG